MTCIPCVTFSPLNFRVVTSRVPASHVTCASCHQDMPRQHMNHPTDRYSRLKVVPNINRRISSILSAPRVEPEGLVKRQPRVCWSSARTGSAPWSSGWCANYLRYCDLQTPGDSVRTTSCHRTRLTSTHCTLDIWKHCAAIPTPLSPGSKTLPCAHLY